MLVQMDLIIAILKELDRQCPGAVISEVAMNALIGAVNLIIAANQPLPKERTHG